LILVDAILVGNGSGAWNFGPDETQVRSVSDVTYIAGDIWKTSGDWVQDLGPHPHEANLLLLNSDKARTNLLWRDKLNFEESIRWTLDWYKDVYYGNDVLQKTLQNVRDFELKG
jgi:CDP-glucose 4,6-dehydratase